jgi:hypothetical protein
MSFGIPVRNGLGVGLLASTFLSSLRVGGRPALFLNFVNTSALDSRITFARSTTATFTNSSGAIQSSAINAPRFDYNPTTLVSRGLLIEEQRINLLLNSLIDGTSLSTQSVTVAAVAHTISFYGTGSITLTGAAVATVTGTGVYPNRQTLTFTPIVGVLVCTVSGSVQYAQLEAGGFATSFIPTAGTAVTRAADRVSMTGTDFSSWYNATEGTFVAEVTAFAAGGQAIYSVDNGVATTRILAQSSLVTQTQFRVVDTADQANIVQTIVASTSDNVRIASAYKANNFATSTNGVAAGVDNVGTVPTGLNVFRIGQNVSNISQLCGCMRSISYYNTRLANSTLQVLTV